MKVAVIGLGSMGKRRLRLFQQAFPEITLVGIDQKEDRQQEVRDLYGIDTFSSLQDIAHVAVDAVVISTSPLSHEAIIEAALEMELHVFTEINLLNDYYDKVMALAARKNSRLYLSSTFLHRKEIAYLKDRVAADANLTYRYHVGQYLPDWHPWESYKDFFVAHKETNGCREIFAIELPWITSVFGDIKSVVTKKTSISDLEIDYPDSYAVIVEHETGIIGAINVNIVSRVAKRELEIIGEETQLEWKGTPDSLAEWSHEDKAMNGVALYESFENQAGYAKNIIEDAYLEEVKEFVALLRNEITETKYSFKKDKNVIDWINEIEGGEQ